MKKAHQYRIYPSRNQEVKLNRTLSTCRYLYNDALAERRKQAELNRLKREFEVFPWGKTEWISYEDQANNLPVCKDSFQKEVHSQVLQNVLKRLDRSFKNLFNGFGYPRFKGRNRYNSFTYPQKGFELDGNTLKLSKIGTVRILYHHDDKKKGKNKHKEIEGKIKTCTIKKDVDQWYAIFTTTVEKTIEPVEIKTTIGVDVGLSSLLTLSDGKKIEPPKFLVKSEKKLVWEQRKLSRKKPGSKNRNKQRIKVVKVHRKIRNQRKDFAHKTSRWLVDSYDMIGFENLNIRGMVQNHHLAKAISDAGWYQLQSFTKYKAVDAGKVARLCIANKTSQECNICGNIEHLTLKDRVFRCSRCGNVEDRDVNAAKNIDNRTVGYGLCRINAWGEYPAGELAEPGSTVLKER
jgi:putative transposase